MLVFWRVSASGGFLRLFPRPQDPTFWPNVVFDDLPGPWMWHTFLEKTNQVEPRKKKKNGLTPPKTKKEPENEPLEEEIPMKNHHF